MSYTPNTTWVDGSGGGTPLSAARLNTMETGITTGIAAPAARVHHNANQSIANNTVTPLAFNSERFDQEAGAASTIHDTVTNNSRLTCRVAGVYLIGGHVQWAFNAAGVRQLGIRVNGATTVGLTDLATTAAAGEQGLTSLYVLAVNDYVQLTVYQNSGGALNVEVAANLSPEFWMVRVA